MKWALYLQATTAGYPEQMKLNKLFKSKKFKIQGIDLPHFIKEMCLPETLGFLEFLYNTLPPKQVWMAMLYNLIQPNFKYSLCMNFKGI